VNQLAHICISLVFLFFLSVEVHAQTDAAIKTAKKTVTDASASLRPYQKFSNNDSTPWFFGGDATLLFRATSLSNWAAGGEDQIAISPMTNMFYNYKKGKTTFENYGTFAYGFLKTGERKAIKSDDRLHFTSKVGRQMKPKVFYTATLLARTQFTPGFSYANNDTIRISDFMAPVYLFVSAGIDYRPSNSFSFVLSPLMGKLTYSNSMDMTILAHAGLLTAGKDEAGADVMIPHRSRKEFGGGALFSFNGNLFKNKLSYNSQVDLFSNYVQKPENVDVYWSFQAKVLLHKNISADLRFEMKYDDDQKTTKEDGTLGGPKTQVKNYTGVGLYYRFK